MVTKNNFVYVKSLFVFGQFSNIKSTIVQTAMLPLPLDLSCFLPPLYWLEFLRIRNAYGKWLHTREIFVCKCVYIYVCVYIHIHIYAIGSNCLGHSYAIANDSLGHSYAIGNDILSCSFVIANDSLVPG